jgi:hypothetical protein
MGKKLSADAKRDLLNKISEHLALEGPRNWDKLSTALGISKVTIFKHVKEIQSIKGTDDKPGLLFGAQRSIKKVLKDLDGQAEKCLPAIPSPNIIASAGESGMVNIRYMVRVDKLLADAEMVRTHSIKIDENGVESIKNPMMFVTSVKLQNDLLRTALAAMQEVYDINKIQDMHRVILEVVGRAAPEVQIEIINALRDLNNRYGLTVEARI